MLAFFCRPELKRADSHRTTVVTAMMKWVSKIIDSFTAKYKSQNYQNYGSGPQRLAVMVHETCVLGLKRLLTF